MAGTAKRVSKTVSMHRLKAGFIGYLRARRDAKEKILLQRVAIFTRKFAINAHYLYDIRNIIRTHE